MRTASFFTYRQGPGRISIARFAPRGTAAGFRIYKPLAPTREMLSMGEARYRDIYFREILGNLDAQRVYDLLQRLAGEWEPVLQCWETPQQIEDKVAGKEFCHRHFVAEWFGDKLGIDVPEHKAPDLTRMPALF